MAASEPRLHDVRMRTQPCGGGDGRLLVPVEDAGHHLALAAQRELEICEQPSDIGTFGAVSAPLVRVDGRAAEVRAEHGIPTGEILDVETHVHGMRLPGEEHDGRVVAVGALDLRQHALFARFDQLEVADAELIFLEHLEDQAVAVIARLDAVDGVI
jgi:hypothetical protein